MQNQTEARDLSDPEVQQACSAALLEVLETMFFEVPLADFEMASAPAELSCLTRAGFHGSVDGVLQLGLSCRTCGRLAASFLGKETAEVAPAEQCSMAQELANMLCGATLSRLQPHGRLAIETPSSIETPQAWCGPWLRYPLEGGTIEVAVSYGEGA